MFPNWFQSRRRHQISPTSPKWPRRFSCSSLKDIQNLLHDDDSSPESYSPRRQVIHQPRSPARIHGQRISNASLLPPTIFSVVDIPNADRRGVVIYYTSLRIIRKTFEECRYVRSILHAFRINIDERDLSMDSRFQDDLQKIFGTKDVTLPKVFIDGRYIGGTKEIKQLHENYELRKLIGPLPPLGKTLAEICDLCRGWRFVICDQCYGSHKIFSEKSGFTSCTACNTQGLVRCVSCFPVHKRRNSKSSGR